MLKRKQANKIDKHFEKLLKRICRSNRESIVANIAVAMSFIKALKLAGVIDYYTVETMKNAVLEAETEAYK